MALVDTVSIPLTPQLRLPADCSDEVDDDPHINRALWDRGILNGASQKVDPALMITIFSSIT